MWMYHRRVKYYETDRMGVVHQSNYLRLLEDARMDWIGDHVMNYCAMEKLGIVIPAVSAVGNFKAFLRYDDPFTVAIRLVEYTGVRMRFVYEVRNEDTGELCYDGETVHCFTLESGLEYRPISIKRKFPQLHEKFLAALEQE